MDILKDPQFMEKIMNQKDKNKVKTLFSEKGVELSLDEIDGIGQEIYYSLLAAYRLSDEESVNISGGGGPNGQDKQEMINDLQQQLDEANKPDTVQKIFARNKGLVVLGGISLWVVSFYGVKTIARYIKSIRNKKNWIGSDEKTKK